MTPKNDPTPEEKPARREMIPFVRLLLSVSLLLTEIIKLWEEF